MSRWHRGVTYYYDVMVRKYYCSPILSYHERATCELTPYGLLDDRVFSCMHDTGWLLVESSKLQDHKAQNRLQRCLCHIVILGLVDW